MAESSSPALGVCVVLLALCGCSSSADAASADDAAGVDSSPDSTSADVATDTDTDTDANDAADAAETPPPDPCAGGTPDPKPAATPSGYGFVELDSATDNPIVSMRTTLTVPPSPAKSGTLFLWPGLQPLPGGTNYDPIDNGVLQPVLTWGPTCAPHAPAKPYDSWWISSQYVNTIGHEPGFTGCQGGEGITVDVGDMLDISMTLSGTVWSQTATSRTTGKVASFDFDLKGQSQHRAELVIEGYSSAPTVPVVFTDTVVTFTHGAAGSCHVLAIGQRDDVTTPVASPDGTRCCLSRVTLRPKGL